MALQPPPIAVPMIDQDGQMAEVWRKFFISAAVSIQSNVAPIDARYVVTRSNTDLTNPINLGLLTSGYLKVAVALSIATVSTVATVPTTDLSGVLQAAQEPAHTGDVTNSAGSLALAIGALKVTNAMLAGSIDLTTKVIGLLPAADFPAMTGDITNSAGSLATTLANTAVTAASYGSATAIASFTVDAKGRLTAAANVTPQLTLTSTYLSSLSGANLTALTAANISAGTAGISVTGNAATTTALQTARTINGVSFDGTANVVIQPSIAASTFEKSETGSDANVLTYTTGGTDEFLNVQIATDVSALTGTSIVVTVTWKDSNNATATSTLTLSAVGDGTINVPLNAFTATAIVVSTVFVGVSTAYKISAFIIRLK